MLRRANGSSAVCAERFAAIYSAIALEAAKPLALPSLWSPVLQVGAELAKLFLHNLPNLEKTHKSLTGNTLDWYQLLWK